MYLKPKCLSSTCLADDVLKADKKSCKKYGPCGVGQKALYLNNIVLDRCYYIPFDSVQRVYKRVAMSKGGYTGKGIFGSIPYLVVEFDGSKERQFTFKYEEDVDRLLACVAAVCPELKRMSKAAEEKLHRRDEERAARILPELSNRARKNVDRLENAAEYLGKKPELSEELSASARRKRALLISKPVYRWVALAITVMGVAAFVYGVYSLLHQGTFAIYFTLFGLAAIFLFSGASVLPTARNNRRAIFARAERAEKAMESYLAGYPDFPVPARYAHPVVLTRMERAIREGRAVEIPEALDVVKKDLKALNADVQVEQDEYDEVVAIKSMFLIKDYA